MFKFMSPVLKNIKIYLVFMLVKIVKKNETQITFIEKTIGTPKKTSTDGYFKLRMSRPFVEYIPIYNNYKSSSTLTLCKQEIFKGKQKIADINTDNCIDNSFILDAKIYSPKESKSKFSIDYPNGINITRVIQSIRNLQQLEPNSLTFKDLLQFTTISDIFNEYQSDTLFIDIMYDETYDIKTWKIKDYLV